MNFLSVEGVGKWYGDRKLFSEISFGLNQGDKVALVARNGTGKTSLLRILAGLEKPDEGKFALRSGIRTGYLEQEPDFKEASTVYQYIYNSGNEIYNVINYYQEAVHSGDMKRIESASAQMDAFRAWDFDSRVGKILSKLDVADLQTPIETLSGGRKKRLALARILCDEPDFLILDEPTNHLDLDMIEWLQDVLSTQSVTLLLVTHDRYFLEEICDRIIELDEGKLYTYSGNYSRFLELKLQRETIFNAGTEKAKNLYATELEWVRRMPKARGTKAKSRLDAFDALEERAHVKIADRNIEFNIKMNRIGGKILELKNIHHSFNNKKLISAFDYTFRKGERIGITGPNGAGKSTLLNIITGKLEPDSGKRNLGETIQFGYFTQHGFKLNDSMKVIDVIRDAADIIPTSDGKHITASQFLTAFHFPPPTQHTMVGKLSGGEKRRLQLVRVLMENPNFLILDEPTNDLDILTLQALEEFLINFQGCLIIVSHDRYFMDKLVERLFVFTGNGNIEIFQGTYMDYRNSMKNKSVNPSEIITSVKSQEKNNKPHNPNKMNFKEKMEWEQLEQQLNDLKLKIEKIDEELVSGIYDHKRIKELSTERDLIKKTLDEKELRWLELSEKSI